MNGNVYCKSNQLLKNIINTLIKIYMYKIDIQKLNSVRKKMHWGDTKLTIFRVIE